MLLVSHMSLEREEKRNVHPPPCLFIRSIQPLIGNHFRRSVPDSRAVQVQRDAVFFGQLADPHDFILRHDCPAECVFQADQCSRGGVDVVAQHEVLLNVVRGEVDVVRGEELVRCRAGKHGDTSSCLSVNCYLAR